MQATAGVLSANRALTVAVQGAMKNDGLLRGPVVGPDWIRADRFELNAKRPDGTTAEQVPEMMQKLLDDRFRLKLHRDQRPTGTSRAADSRGRE